MPPKKDNAKGGAKDKGGKAGGSEDKGKIFFTFYRLIQSAYWKCIHIEWFPVRMKIDFPFICSSKQFMLTISHPRKIMEIEFFLINLIGVFGEST
jgi:hypothetical protein